MSLEFSKINKFELILLIYCFIVIFFGDYIPIEFTNIYFRVIFYSLLYISFPILLTKILITASKIKKQKSFIILMTVTSFIVLFFVALAHFICGIQTEIVYKNRTNSQMIVKKSLSCGATDTSVPEETYYKIIPITSFMNIITKFDTTNINKNEWIKYNPYLFK